MTTTRPTHSRSSLSRRRLGVVALLAGLAAVALSFLALSEQTAPARRALAEVHTSGGSARESGDEYGRINGLISPYADHPAIDRLDPELLRALRRAAERAKQDDIDLRVTSGWRSRAYQQDLLDAAIQKYGSRSEALQWVQTPDGSSHTTGDAIDVGPTDAAYWLSQNGSNFGLCQTYSNEIWHYELTTAPGGQCPTPRADGTS